MTMRVVRKLGWWWKRRVPRIDPRKWTSAGGVVFNSSGQIALVRQRSRRAGLRWTFPKGRVDAGETVQQAALREVHEESGLRASITAYIGCYESKRRVVHYYVMDLVGADGAHDHETEEVRFVAPARARALLRSRRDRSVLKRALDRALGLET